MQTSFPDGEQGVTIKDFKSELHAEVTIPEVPKNTTLQDKMCKVTLAGKADDVLKAKESIPWRVHNSFVHCDWADRPCRRTKSESPG